METNVREYNQITKSICMSMHMKMKGKKRNIYGELSIREAIKKGCLKLYLKML